MAGLKAPERTDGFFSNRRYSALAQLAETPLANGVSAIGWRIVCALTPTQRRLSEPELDR